MQANGLGMEEAAGKGDAVILGAWLAMEEGFHDAFPRPPGAINGGIALHRRNRTQANPLGIPSRSNVRYNSVIARTRRDPRAAPAALASGLCALVIAGRSRLRSRVISPKGILSEKCSP